MSEQCPFCGEDMLFRPATIIDGEIKTKSFWKCPDCFMTRSRAQLAGESFCPRCGTELNRHGHVLQCGQCGYMTED